MLVLVIPIPAPTFLELLVRPKILQASVLNKECQSTLKGSSSAELARLPNLYQCRLVFVDTSQHQVFKKKCQEWWKIGFKIVCRTTKQGRKGFGYKKPSDRNIELLVSERFSLPVKVFIHFSVLATGHIRSSSNHNLPRSSKGTVVTWSCAKHVPAYLTHSSSISVLEIKLQNPLPEA